MTDDVRGNAAWRQAVDWIVREHDESFDDAARRALLLWLAEAASHRQAYEEARRLWLLTGMVPTADEQDEPPPGDH